MVTLDDVRSVALALPRTTEVLVRGRVKFRVGRIVYASFSRDEMQDLIVDAWAMTVPRFELERVLQLRDPAVFAELDEAIEAVQKPAIVQSRPNRPRVDR